MENSLVRGCRRTRGRRSERQLDDGESVHLQLIADALVATVDEDASVVISLAGSDIDAGDSVEKFRIDSLPSGGEGTRSRGR